MLIHLQLNQWRIGDGVLWRVYYFPSKYDLIPDTTGSTFCCLRYSYLQLDFKMTNAPPGTF